MMVVAVLLLSFRLLLLYYTSRRCYYIAYLIFVSRSFSFFPRFPLHSLNVPYDCGGFQLYFIFYLHPYYSSYKQLLSSTSQHLDFIYILCVPYIFYYMSLTTLTNHYSDINYVFIHFILPPSCHIAFIV